MTLAAWDVVPSPSTAFFAPASSAVAPCKIADSLRAKLRCKWRIVRTNNKTSESDNFGSYKKQMNLFRLFKKDVSSHEMMGLCSWYGCIECRTEMEIARLPFQKPIKVRWVLLDECHLEINHGWILTSRQADVWWILHEPSRQHFAPQINRLFGKIRRWCWTSSPQVSSWLGRCTWRCFVLDHSISSPLIGEETWLNSLIIYYSLLLKLNGK